MSERPKWMPSKDLLIALAHNTSLYLNCGQADALEDLEHEIHRSCVEAQIDVLENCYSEDYPDNVCENIEYKLAALRRELGG